MLTNRDIKMMGVAKAAAKTSRHHKAKVGAALAVGKDLISVGVNGRKSHPLQQKYSRFETNRDRTQHLLHAEMEAIVKGKAHVVRVDNATMYVYRIMKSGDNGMSRPCKGCLDALKDFGIQRIVYTTGDGIATEVID